MKAAVVSSFDRPPRCEEFPVPSPRDEDEILVDVVAAGLHPRVRSQADGTHYTSTRELPLVPGIDGVGRAADGRLLYFVLPDTTMGAMAEKTVIDARRSIPLPAGTDPIAVAAAMNPAMSSWIALRRRTQLQPGQKVLVLGATGNAGELAIAVARKLGASQIVAAGRDAERLSRLAGRGATEVVRIEGEPEGWTRRLGEAAAEVDLVLDYVWGETTAAAMVALVTGRADCGKLLTWIEIGSVAGPEAHEGPPRRAPSAGRRAHGGHLRRRSPCDAPGGRRGGLGRSRPHPPADRHHAGRVSLQNKVANGGPIPVDPAHAQPILNGVCTTGAGALVCVSGVCDVSNNTCGYVNGDGP